MWEERANVDSNPLENSAYHAVQLIAQTNFVSQQSAQTTIVGKQITKVIAKK